MALAVLVTERLSPGLRGAISKWLVEINPGTYIGTLSARLRSQLWAQISAWVGTHELGYALLIHPDNTEQGYTLHTAGTSAYAVTVYDGLALIARRAETGQIRPDQPNPSPESEAKDRIPGQAGPSPRERG